MNRRPFKQPSLPAPACTKPASRSLAEGRRLGEGRGEGKPARRTNSLAGGGEGAIKKIRCLSLILLLCLLGTGCATSKEEHAHGEASSIKTYPKDYVHSLTEINLEKIIDENRGLKVLEENARTVHDYYRGGVQEKAEGERLMKEGKWEEARTHLEKSNRFLHVVLDYFSKDEAYWNIYGDHVVIFLPNLLIADNYLKVVRIYHKLKMDDEIYWAARDGKKFLSFSLRSVKTEWGFQIKKGFEEASHKR